jgi:hypothetical protein
VVILSKRARKIRHVAFRRAMELSIELINDAMAMCGDDEQDKSAAVLSVAIGQIKAATIILATIEDNQFAAEVLRLEATMLLRTGSAPGEPRKPPH